MLLMTLAQSQTRLFQPSLLVFLAAEGFIGYVGHNNRPRRADFFNRDVCFPHPIGLFQFVLTSVRTAFRIPPERWIMANDVEEVVVETFRQLTPENQQKVLAYLKSLPSASGGALSRKDPCGMFAHHGVDVPLEIFQEARSEMWANFPRNFPEVNSR
jgi:hypothetical protein